MNICQHCGNTYEAERVTSKFCGDKCRVKAYRESKRETRLNLDTKKVEFMVALLRTKIKVISDDIAHLKELQAISKVESTVKVYGDMIRERNDILRELVALNECLD